MLVKQLEVKTSKTGKILSILGGTALGGELARRKVIENTGQTPEDNMGSFWGRIKRGEITTGEWLTSAFASPLVSFGIESAQDQSVPEDTIRSRFTNFYESEGENPNLWEKVKLAFGWDGYAQDETITGSVQQNLFSKFDNTATGVFEKSVPGVLTTPQTDISQPMKSRGGSSSSSRVTKNTSPGISKSDRASAGQKGSNYVKIIRKSGKVEVRKKRFA